MLLLFQRILNSFEAITEALIKQENFSNIIVSGDHVTFQATQVSLHCFNSMKLICTTMVTSSIIQASISQLAHTGSIFSPSK